MKKRALSVAALAMVALLAFAVIRAHASRELILKTNGLPMANLKGNISANVSPGSFGESTSTDPDGRLDLSGVPWEADQIMVELRDDTGNVRLSNRLITPPKHGSCTIIDFRGRRTVVTTTRTYLDLGLFKFRVHEKQTWDEVSAAK